MTSTDSYHHDLSFADYCNISAANQSVLKKGIGGTPADMLAAMRNDEEPTDAMKFGTAFHTLLLEPEKFNEKYLVCEDPDNNHKGRGPWKAFADEADARGLIPLKWSAFQDMNQMPASIRSSKRLMKHLTPDVDIEATCVWRDRTHGVMCKARLDIVNHDTKTVIDIKTAVDARPGPFAKAANLRGYGFQAAWYTHALRVLRGGGYRYLIAAVQKSAPFHCTVHEFDSERLDWEHERCMEQLATYARCLESGEWPGYDDVVHTIGMDPWLTTDGVQTTQVGGELITTTLDDLGLSDEEMAVLS